jgi:hypothetical protein
VPIVELAVAAVGKKAAAAVIEPLLRELLELQDQQARALEGLREDVRKLVEGPRHRARTALEDALLAQGERRRQLLEEVSTALREAHSHEAAPTATRAEAAAEMAVVAVLLERRDEGCRWAQRAHEDARAAIRSEIPALTMALGRRGNPVSRAIDSFRWSWERQYRFWASLTDYSKYSNDVVDRDLWRMAFTRTFVEGLILPDDPEQRAATLRLPSRGQKADFAGLMASIAQGTPQGVRLMRLHSLSVDAENYRQVRLHLCGQSDLPVERLRVDVSVPYRARLEWAAI